MGAAAAAAAEAPASAAAATAAAPQTAAHTAAHAHTHTQTRTPQDGDEPMFFVKTSFTKSADARRLRTPDPGLVWMVVCANAHMLLYSWTMTLPPGLSIVYWALCTGLLVVFLHYVLPVFPNPPAFVRSDQLCTCYLYAPCN